MRSGRDKVPVEIQYNTVLRKHDVLFFLCIYPVILLSSDSNDGPETVKYVIISEACGFVTADHHGEPPVVSLRG